MPESFKVLVKELQSLALDVRVLDKNKKEIELADNDDDDGYEKLIRQNSFADEGEMRENGF